MGISNRDYYRDDPPPGSSFGRTRSYSAVTWIIGITGVCFFLQLLFSQPAPILDRVSQWLALHEVPVMRGQVWRLVSYAFVHDSHGLFHILINMYILYLVAPDFESRHGSREFVAFYLAAAAAAGLLFLMWGAFLNNTGSCVGASGAVNALFLIYALRYPNQTWLFFFVIPMKAIWLLGIKVFFDLYPMLVELGRGDAFGDQVAHSAHIGGLLFGYLYLHFNWSLTRWLPSGGLSALKRTLKRKPKLKIHNPPHDTHDESKVDELLDKIQRKGEASLTDDERAILMEASRRARDRKSHSS